MTTQLAPTPVFKGWDNNGRPLAFGKLYSYIAGTTTPTPTFTDSTGSTPNTNPVILNARGECALWLDPTQGYKLNLTDSSGNQIPGWPVDNIIGPLNINQSLIPAADNTYDLGSTSSAWRQLYLGANHTPVLDTTSGIVGYYPRTAAEIAAGVTPVNYAWPPGWAPRYGVVDDNLTDNTTALTNAAKISGTHPLILPITNTGIYKITTGQIALPNNAQIIGLGRPTIFCTTAGADIFHGVGLTGEPSITGVIFQGASASAIPLSGYGGFAASSTGLVTFANCSNIRVDACEFSASYFGLSFLGCAKISATRNEIYNFQNTGLEIGSCGGYIVTDNYIHDCTQTGAAVAYGIQCSGNIEGGYAGTQNIIANNKIYNVPSWDGIGSHDTDGLAIIGNDIRGVRKGLDIGHLASTNIVKNIRIVGNYIESTTVDTYAGASAEHGGILIEGYDATHRVDGAIVTGNLIRNFFTVAGLNAGGNPANITIANCDGANVAGNSVIGAGPLVTDCGVLVLGTCNRCSITGNSLQGDFQGGPLRISSATADVMTIVGNQSEQTTPANGHIIVTGSTISALSLGNNPTNATGPYQESGSTVTLIGGSYSNSYTGTLTGCTTSPTNTVYYTVEGNTVTLFIGSATATSNATTCTLTGMPASIRPVRNQECLGGVIDNGTAEVGQYTVGTNGTITLATGLSGAFTSTGTKGISASTISYSLV